MVSGKAALGISDGAATAFYLCEPMIRLVWFDRGKSWPQLPQHSLPKLSAKFNTIFFRKMRFVQIALWPSHRPAPLRPGSFKRCWNAGALGEKALIDIGLTSLPTTSMCTSGIVGTNLFF